MCVAVVVAVVVAVLTLPHGHNPVRCSQKFQFSIPTPISIPINILFRFQSPIPSVLPIQTPIPIMPPIPVIDRIPIATSSSDSNLQFRATWVPQPLPARLTEGMGFSCVLVPLGSAMRSASFFSSFSSSRRFSLVV